MAVEKDFELLDDYLANRLQGSDRVAFEERIQSDPELAQALQNQQHIIDGLRKARMAELKAMLQAVPVPPAATGMSTFLKITAGTFSAALVGLVLYFGFFNADEPAPVPTEKPVATEQHTKSSVPQPETNNEVVIAEENKTTTASEKETKKPKDVSTVQPNVTKPVIEAFTPTEEQGETVARQEMDAPVTSNATRVSTKSSITAEINTDNKKFTFHYVLINDRLTLYGNFEKNIYEIIEVFNNDKRTAFLFYKNNYYLLNTSDTKVKPLTPINDPVLLEKLKEYRNQQ